MFASKMYLIKSKGAGTGNTPECPVSIVIVLANFLSVTRRGRDHRTGGSCSPLHQKNIIFFSFTAYI